MHFVVIRSNSAETTLTINDSSNDSEIKHYGYLGELQVTQCAMHSYYENGTVGYAEIKKGHIVVENEGSIELVYKNTDTATDVMVETTDNGKVEHAHANSSTAAVNNDADSKALNVTFDYNNNPEQNTNTDVYHHVAEGEREGIQAGDKKITDANYNVDEAATEAITKVHDDELSDTVVKAVSDSTTSYYSFADFRDGVNAGTIETANVSFSLMANVDLKGVEWTPIGTETHPFQGNFDGCGYTISNFKITSTGSYNGVFGKVVGVTEGATFKTIASDVWDSENYLLKDGTYSENLFKTVLKNFNVSDFTVITGEYGAAAIGWAENAYLQSIIVSNGTVSDNHTIAGKIAGVVGVSAKNMVYSKLETTSDVTVSGSKHSIGGIVSNIQRAAAISYTDNHFVLIKDCVNRASVNWTENGATSGGVPIAGIVANAGSCTGLTSVIYNCSNEGTITAGDCNYACGIIGQAGDWVKGIYGCSNSGNITANAVTYGVAGICITESIPAVDCSNTGILINTADAEKVYDISASTSVLYIVNEEFENVDALQTRLNNAVGTVKSLVLKNITVNDTTGCLTIPGSIRSISSNKKICSSVSLNSTVTTINLIGLTQDIACDRVLTFSGSNNTITVAENTTSAAIVLAGSNNKVINNGTLASVSVQGNGTGLVVENNGTMDHFTMIGTTAEVTLNNNGIISRSDGGHTIWLECSGKLTLNNKGSITNTKNGCALLFYDGCNVTVNAFDNSTVTGGLYAYRGTHTINIYYKDDATINGKAWTTVASKTYGVYVYAMN